jgi:hypothetical protein
MYIGVGLTLSSKIVGSFLRAPWALPKKSSDHSSNVTLFYLLENVFFVAESTLKKYLLLLC